MKDEVKIEVIGFEHVLTEVSYAPVVSAICAVRNVPFQGTANISYVPNGYLLEFESFDLWLQSISLTETTIEGLTRMIFDALRSVLGDIPLRVTFEATTAVHAPVSVTIIQTGEETR